MSTVHRALPSGLADVLTWLRERYPTAAMRIELAWAEDPSLAEAELRALLPTCRAARRRKVVE